MQLTLTAKIGQPNLSSQHAKAAFSVPTEGLVTASAFTLSAGAGLAKACQPAVEDEPANVSTVPARAAAMENWLKALCAPSSSPVWRGAYDPAYMPQQQALTVGFVCIVTCEASGVKLSADAMADLSSYSAAARDDICDALPWDDAAPARFGGTTRREELARLTEPLLDTPCTCGEVVAPTSPGAPLWRTFTAGGAAVARCWRSWPMRRSPAGRAAMKSWASAARAAASTSSRVAPGRP